MAIRGSRPPSRQRVQKLHLVGFTTDQKGLILSARRGARSGSFHLSVDDDLADAVQELRAKQVEEEAEQREEAEASRPSRVESALSVREIQARLRQGRSVADVAKAAGVDPEWVERFAPPVFAERAQVISRVRSSALRRARLGPSQHTVDESIRRNLADRGVAVSPEEIAESWSARQLADGRWAVRFRYRHRNRDHVVRFDLDETSDDVVAADRASSQLAYIPPTSPPPRPSRPRPEPTVPSPVPRAPKRATVTVGFRPDDAAGRATSRAAKERERASDAMRKAALQAAAEAERAAARREKERAAEAVRRERAAKAEAARKERERVVAERARAAAAKKKAADAKKRAAERAMAKAAKVAADQARRAEAALRTAERKEAARRKAAATAKSAQAAAAKKKTKATTPTNKKAATKRKATTKRKAAPAAKRTSPGATEPDATPRPDPPPVVTATPVIPAPRDDGATGDVRILGPVSALRRTGPTFRSGLVEAVDRPTATPVPVEPAARPDPSSPSPNGRAPERAPGERRTRPLRAT